MTHDSDRQLAQIIAGATAFRTYEFPGNAEASIAVRCLSEIELDHCRLQAQVKLRSFAGKRGWEPASMVDVDPEYLTRLMQREIILKAFYRPETTESEDPKPFFSSDSDVQRLTSVQVERLFAIYMEHQDDTNPRVNLTTEQVKKLVKDLGKEQAARAALSTFGRDTLISFVHILASEVQDT